jgi:hypothetical protein
MNQGKWTRQWLVLSIGLLWTLGGGASIAARAVTIAAPDGPAPVIIAPARPSAVLTPAIEDLQHYLSQITGQKIEVVQTAPAGRMAIQVGLPDAELQKAINQRHLDDQGFVLDISDKHIRILGGRDFGTRNGVYELLNRMGVRWLFPGQWGEVLPPPGPIDLSPGQTVDQPVFTIREMHQYARHAPTQYGDWARRNREAACGYSGHSGLILKYKKSHPEWFALIDGKRQADAKNPKLCHSNPQMVKQAIADVLEGIAAVKQSDRPINSQLPIAPASTGYVYSISPTDGGGFCRCENCLKIGSVSDRLQIFANTLAAAVAKKFPGEYVGYYGAYSEAQSPPTVKAAPNVMVFATTWTKDFFQTLDDLKNTPFQKKKAAWAAMCPNMGIRDFDGMPVWWGYGPAFLGDVHAADYKWYAAHHVRGFITEGTDHWAGFGLSYYVTAKLWWNPNADVNALERDFIQKGFGAAYEPMSRYYGHITKERGFLQSSSLLAMRNDLEKAASLAVRPDVKHRIDCLRLYHLLLATMNDAQMGQASNAQLLTAARVGQSLVGKNIVSKGMVDALLKLYQTQASTKAEVQPYTPAELSQVLAEMKLPVVQSPLADWPPQNDQRLVPADAKPATFTPVLNASFRYGPSTVLIYAKPGENIEVSPANPKTSVRYELRSPEQAVVASGVFDSAHPLKHVAGNGGIYNLQFSIEGRWTQLNVTNRYAVIKAASPSEKLHPMGKCSLYFQVPAGTKEFAVVARSGGEKYTLGIWGPAKAAKPLLQTPLSANENFAAYRIQVPAGADGQVWRLQFNGEDKEIFLRGVPPLLASDPARLLRLSE